MSNQANIIPCTETGIHQAAQIIKEGGLVAFPTETVYGLGANALNDEAVKQVFIAKHRPATDPLIVHIFNISQIDDIFEFSNDENNFKAREIAIVLGNKFWPGPLTLIYKAKPIIPLSVTSGTGFVGLRIPKHPIARKLLEISNLPIAAPSANRFGHVSPTSSLHVYEDLKNENISILEDNIDISGGCSVGIESTVVSISSLGDRLSILRCGAITSIDLADTLLINNINCIVTIDNEKVINKNKSNNSSIDESINTSAIAPGQMIRHYSPDIPTYILKNNHIINIQNEIKFQRIDNNNIDDLILHLSSIMIIDYNQQLLHLKSFVAYYIDLSTNGDITEAYKQLFYSLRLAESNEIRNIGVSNVVLVDLSNISITDERIRALWERLHRAASGIFLNII